MSILKKLRVLKTNNKENELCPEFKKYLVEYEEARDEDNKQISTIRDNLASLGVFLMFCQNNNLHPQDFTKREFKAFFKYLDKQRNCGVKTRKKYLHMLSTFYYIQGYKNLFEYQLDSRKTRRYSNLPEIHYSKITPDEYDLIRDKLFEKIDYKKEDPYAGSSNFSRIRDLIAIETLWETGCRKSEVLNLKYIDFNKSKKTFTIVETKNYTEREVPFSDELAVALQEHMSKNKLTGLDDYIFQNTQDPKKPIPSRHLSKIFKEVVDELRKESKIEGRRVVLHSLRHARIVLFLKEGMPIHEVQRIAGHDSINTTIGYAHMKEMDHTIIPKAKEILNQSNKKR